MHLVALGSRDVPGCLGLLGLKGLKGLQWLKGFKGFKGFRVVEEGSRAQGSKNESRRPLGKDRAICGWEPFARAQAKESSEASGMGPERLKCPLSRRLVFWLVLLWL